MQEVVGWRTGADKGDQRMVVFNDKRVEALHIRPLAPSAKEESKIDIGLAKRDRPAIGEPVEATDPERAPPRNLTASWGAAAPARPPESCRC
jgi:hypothetical protein